MNQKKTDPRRHLVPAMYAWLVENFSRVHIAAATSHPDIRIPASATTKNMRCPIDTVNDKGELGRNIVDVNVVFLNFGVDAIAHFHQDEKGLHAKMRFNGMPYNVFLPYDSIVSMYSPDDDTHSMSMNFTLHYGQEDLALKAKTDDAKESDKSDQQNEVKRIRPALTVVK